MFARRAVGRTSSSRLPGLLARCNLLRVGMLKLIGSCHSTSRPCSASAYVCQATDAAHVERVFSGSLASTSCSYSPSTPSYRRLAGWSAPSKVATVRMPAGRARAAASGSGAVSWPTEAIGQVVGASSNFVRVELAAWDEPQAHVAEDGGLHAAAAAHHRPMESAPTRQLLCNIRALLFKLRQTVLVGDYVRVRSIDWGAARGVVGDVLPRVSELTDPSVANVGHLLLVFALDQPPFEEVQVSRFLVSAEAAGLPFSLCLNKADLVEPQVLAARVEQCRSWGYDPLVMSCESGEGVTQVAQALQGRTSVVAGPSGAGKTSLINTLRLGRHRPDLAPLGLQLATFGAPAPASGSDSGTSSSTASEASASTGAFDVQTDMPFIPAEALGFGKGAADGSRSAGPSLASGGEETGPEEDEEAELEWLAVGSVSKIGRGKHTTTTVRLIKLLGGGMLADTPGFGQPSLDGVESSSLWTCFPELRGAVEAAACRFSDCLHVAEPGCSVLEAETEFERYPLYLRCLEEIRAREEHDTKVLQAGKRLREGNAKIKAARGGATRVEARLDSKRHRATSRRAAKQGLMAELAEQQEEGQLQL